MRRWFRPRRPMRQPITVTSSAATVQGFNRVVNEDAHVLGDDLFAVFDGVGGEPAGRLAAHAAAKAAQKAWKARKPDRMLIAMNQAVRRVGGACTAVVLGRGESGWKAWTIGDSSLFILRDGVVLDLAPKDAQRNRLTCYLGMENLHGHAFQVPDADGFLLATDGAKLNQESVRDWLGRRATAQQGLEELGPFTDDATAVAVYPS